MLVNQEIKDRLVMAFLAVLVFFGPAGLCVLSVLAACGMVACFWYVFAG